MAKPTTQNSDIGVSSNDLPPLRKVIMQPVFVNKDVENEYYTPLLTFGKTNLFKMPLWFLDLEKAKECRADLLKFIGKKKSELEAAHDEIIEKYKSFSSFYKKTHK